MRANIIILMLLIVITSCKKDENNNTDYYYGKVSSQLYPFLFDEGSYWIYLNQDSTISDSIVIDKISIDSEVIGPLQPGQGSQGEEEYYNIKYLSDVYGVYYEQIVGAVISKGCIYGGYLYITGDVGQNVINATIGNVYDSLIINNTTYYNVVKMELEKDEYLETNQSRYYVDSVGIIKKEIKNDANEIIEAWELLRYNIDLLEIE